MTTSRSSLSPATVAAVKKLATKHTSQFQARKDLHALAEKMGEKKFLVRALFRRELKAVQEASK